MSPHPPTALRRLARTLADFTLHLRDELNVASLETDLVDVVRDAMQPAHVSLWLRDGR